MQPQFEGRYDKAWDGAIEYRLDRVYHEVALAARVPGKHTSEAHIMDFSLRGVVSWLRKQSAVSSWSYWQ